MATVTEKQRAALAQASKREGGTLCPLRNGLHANAEMQFLFGLVRRGLVDMNGGGKGVPTITEAGHQCLAQQ